MKEIEKAIKKESLKVPEKIRESWIKLSLKYAELCLEKGDSVESIIKFIYS